MGALKPLRIDHPVHPPDLVQRLDQFFAHEGVQRAAHGFQLEIEHGAHVFAGKQRHHRGIAGGAHLQNQPGHALARIAKIQIGQPVVGFFQAAVPFLQQALVQAWRFAVEALDHLQRQTADLDRGERDGVGIVGGAHQGFQPHHIARAQHAHDALAAIDRVAHQLDHARPQGVERGGRFTHAHQRLMGGEFQIVDGRMDEVEVFLAQIGKQDHVPDAAVAAVRSAAPGRFGFDGDHAEEVGALRNVMDGRQI